MDNSLLHSSIDERRRENYGNEYIYIYIQYFEVSRKVCNNLIQNHHLYNSINTC